MTDLDGRTRIEISIDKLMRRERISRRAFMRRAGRGGIALGALATIPGILAACAPSSGSSGAASSEVRWLNWPAYIDISDDGSTNPSIDAFKEETGLEVEYDEGLLDNADFLAQYAPDLRAGNEHRLGRHVARRLGGGAHGAPRLAGGARPLQAAELDGQHGGLRQGPVVRRGQQVQRLVAGRHHRHRLRPEPDRPRDHHLRRPAGSGLLRTRRRLQRHARHVRADAAVARRGAGERQPSTTCTQAQQKLLERAARATSAASTATSITTRWPPATWPSPWPGRATSAR